MTKKNSKKLEARARKEQFGGRYENHLRHVGGVTDGPEGRSRIGLSDGTRRVLQFLLSSWRSARAADTDPAEHRAFDVPGRIVESALLRPDATDADIRAAIPVCPMYPNHSKSTLRDLAEAERRGSRVEVQEREDGSTTWQVLPARKADDPLAPLEAGLDDLALREAICRSALASGRWQDAGFDAAWCLQRAGGLAAELELLGAANRTDEIAQLEAAIRSARKRADTLFAEAKLGPHNDLIEGLVQLKRGLREHELRAPAIQHTGLRTRIGAALANSNRAVNEIWSAATDIASGVLRDEEKRSAVTDIDVGRVLRALAALKDAPRASGRA